MQGIHTRFIFTDRPGHLIKANCMFVAIIWRNTSYLLSNNNYLDIPYTSNKGSIWVQPPSRHPVLCCRCGFKCWAVSCSLPLQPAPTAARAAPVPRPAVLVLYCSTAGVMYCSTVAVLQGPARLPGQGAAILCKSWRHIDCDCKYYVVQFGVLDTSLAIR